MIHLVEEIIDIKPYKLYLKFNTGEVKQIDLRNKLEQKSTTHKSMYKQLLTPEYFKKVELNTEMKSIYWPNGVDFCPDTLYEMGEVI